MVRLSRPKTCFVVAALLVVANSVQLDRRRPRRGSSGLLGQHKATSRSTEAAHSDISLLATETTVETSEKAQTWASSRARGKKDPKPEEPKEIECCNICPGQFVVASLFLDLSPVARRAAHTNFAAWAAARTAARTAPGTPHRLHVPARDAPALLEAAERTENPVAWETVPPSYRLPEDLNKDEDKAGKGGAAKAPKDAKGGVVKPFAVTSNGEDSPCCKICPVDYVPPAPATFLQLADAHGVSALADAHRAVAACEAHRSDGARKDCRAALSADTKRLLAASGLGVDAALVRHARAAAAKEEEARGSATAVGRTGGDSGALLEVSVAADATAAVSATAKASGGAAAREGTSAAFNPMSMLSGKKKTPKLWCCIVCSIAFEPPRSWMDPSDFLQVAEGATEHAARRRRREQRTHTSAEASAGLTVQRSGRDKFSLGSAVKGLAAGAAAAAAGVAGASALSGGKDGKGQTVGRECCSMCPISLTPLGSGEEQGMRGKLKMSLDRSIKDAATTGGLLGLSSKTAPNSVPITANGEAAVANPSNKRTDYGAKEGLI